MKLATHKEDDGDADLHKHAEGKNSTLQLLPRSLAVIFPDQAVREAETLRVVNILQQTCYSNHACFGSRQFYLCCTAGAAGGRGLIKVTSPDKIWCWSV